MAKYDFSKVSREALEAYAALNLCSGNSSYSEGMEVLRQARVRAPEEVALDLAEYCASTLCPESIRFVCNRIDPVEGMKIRALADEYRKLIVHK